MTAAQAGLIAVQMAGVQPPPYKVFPDDTAVWVYRMAFGARLCIGHIDDRGGYDRGFCYADLDRAFAAADAWNGQGDPEGWMKNLQTGRYRKNGDPAKEYGPEDREPE